MSAPDRFSPTMQRLQLLLAQSEQLRRQSGVLSAETTQRIAETEKLIAECVEQLGRELLK